MPQTQKDPREPTAVAPDEVAKSVPGAVERAGKTGPNAADPPRAQRDADRKDRVARGDYELDPDEAADAFEELDESLRKRRDDAPERQDENIVTLDTPD